MPEETNEGLKEWRRPPTYLHLHCHSLGPGCHCFSPGWFQQLPQWFPWVHSNFSHRKFIPYIAEALSGHLKSTIWPIALPPKTSSMASHCPWLKSKFLSAVYRTLCDPALGQRKIHWEVLWHPCDRCGKTDRKGWHGEMFRKQTPPGFWPWLYCIGLCHLSLSFSHRGWWHRWSQRAVSVCSRYASWLPRCLCLSGGPPHWTDMFIERFLSADMSHRLQLAQSAGGFTAHPADMILCPEELRGHVTDLKCKRKPGECPLKWEKKECTSNHWHSPEHSSWNLAKGSERERECSNFFSYFRWCVSEALRTRLGRYFLPVKWKGHRTGRESMGHSALAWPWQCHFSCSSVSLPPSQTQ